MKLLLSLALPLYALDQATKWWVFKNLPFEGEPRVVIPDYFSLVHWGNTGAAFSSFHNSNTAFMVLSLVALVGLVTFFLRGAFVDLPSRIAVGLLIGGILGNLTDRIVHGHVIDFLLVDLHVRFAHPWPAFNVADSCICIAAGIFILTAFKAETKAA